MEEKKMTKKDYFQSALILMKISKQIRIMIY